MSDSQGDEMVYGVDGLQNVKSKLPHEMEVEPSFQVDNHMPSSLAHLELLGEVGVS